MIYLLDTNACIVYLNRRVSSVRQRLENLSPQDVAVCSIVKAELFYGAMKSNNPERSLAKQSDEKSHSHLNQSAVHEAD